MTEGDAGASLVGKGTENVFVTLDVAAQLTNFSPEYVERLCRDGYVPCAGGADGLLFPQIAELLTVLNISLPPDTNIEYVPAALITEPLLTREQLLTKALPAAMGLVGNHPVGVTIGGITEPAPLRRGALSFALVSDEEEPAQVTDTVESAPPPPPPPLDLPALEVPPVPAPKELPSHWPVKTSNDATQHFDDAPLMPPLATKRSEVVSTDALAQPGPVLPAVHIDVVPTVFVEQLPEVATAKEIINSSSQELMTQSPEALEVKPEDALALPEVHELLVPDEQSVMLPEHEEIMAPPTQSLADSLQEKVILTPDQNLVHTVAQSIDVGHLVHEEDGNERPAIFPPGVEQVSTAVDASWYTPKDNSELNHEEVAVGEGVETALNSSSTEEENVQEESEGESVVEIQKEVVAKTPPAIVINPTPPAFDRDISARILEEAARSKATIPLAADDVESTQEEQVPIEPIVAVPHYAVAQLTPSMHPLALPPRVVPFATMVPAAYPQVAAVFTQPHARASEWLPWMRTSHFSRSAVQVATNPELHPAYPRYSRPPAQEVAPIVAASATTVRPIANPGDASIASPQKVFVSVVGKPVAPIAIAVEKHVAPTISTPAPVPKVLPPAEDAWDEMLAPQAARDETLVEKFEEIPQKSREELLKEVSADIKDSWDASFLAGLGTA